MIILVDSKILAYKTASDDSKSMAMMYQDVAASVLDLEAIFHIKTTQLVFTWDIGKSSHRLALWPDYKGGRSYKTLPEDFNENYNVRLKQLGVALGSRIVGVEGVEADDLISIIVNSYTGSELVVIMTADRDLLQCTIGRDNVHFYDPRQHRLLETSFLSVESFLFAKAILGDDGDNIKGILGFGEASLAKLMKTKDLHTLSYEELAEVFIAVGESKPQFAVSGKYLEAGVISHSKDFSSLFHFNMALGRTMVDLQLLSPAQKETLKGLFNTQLRRKPLRTGSIHGISLEINGGRTNFFGAPNLLDNSTIDFYKRIYTCGK